MESFSKNGGNVATSLQVHKETLDRVEARGVGFSEMQSFWSLPFHDHATVGDVCVSRYVAGWTAANC